MEHKLGLFLVFNFTDFEFVKPALSIVVILNMLRNSSIVICI